MRLSVSLVCGCDSALRAFRLVEAVLCCLASGGPLEGAAFPPLSLALLRRAASLVGKTAPRPSARWPAPPACRVSVDRRKQRRRPPLAGPAPPACRIGVARGEQRRGPPLAGPAPP